jgi:hypothetical protein
VLHERVAAMDWQGHDQGRDPMPLFLGLILIQVLPVCGKNDAMANLCFG